MDRAALRACLVDALGPRGTASLLLAVASARRLAQPKPPAPPVPVPDLTLAQIRVGLEAAGIGSGDVILVHSSLAGLATAPPDGASRFAADVAALLIDLVSPGGTVLMPTDAIRDPREFALYDREFDFRRHPSRRGPITEAFRLRSDTIRSPHPWGNVTAWGRHSEELLRDHLLSEPYAMDRHSPWFKLTAIGGKLVFLGTDLMANQSIVLQHHVLGRDYPVGVFFDKPVVLRFRDAHGGSRKIQAMVDVHDWNKTHARAFVAGLDAKYRLYRRTKLGAGEIVVCDAKAQLDALLAEVAAGVHYAEARFGNVPTAGRDSNS